MQVTWGILTDLFGVTEEDWEGWTPTEIVRDVLTADQLRELEEYVS